MSSSQAHAHTAVEPVAVSVEIAGQMLGLGRTMIYELIAEGRLKSTKIGQRRLVSVASIRNLIEGEA